MNQELVREFIFWGIWLVIPLIVDILTGLSSGYVVLRRFFNKRALEVDFYPHVTILVPIYKSEKTIENCLKSIANQNYPIKNLQVFLINNGPRDNSYDIFCRFQNENPRLRLWWFDSSKGKAKALNKGLYMSQGKYVINIDSDGVLDKNAVLKVVEKFENNLDINAMTGVILIDKSLIEKTKNMLLRILQRCELFEYSEAFFIGRGFQSQRNRMFTIAGAFSCFRKDIVLKTQLFNNETLGEDTHMTSQIREFLKGRVALCEEAFFYLDPIENLDRLYIQRQRWQRGQVEVSSLFRDLAKKNNKGLKNVLKYTMVKDHTLVFPRLIWIFAMMYLAFLDYPLELIIGANIIMYLAYVFNSFIYFQVSKLYLREQRDVRKYMGRHCYVVLLLPLYRFLSFLMRIAGIINSTKEHSAWNTKTFSEEKMIVKDRVIGRLHLYYKAKEWVNNG